MLSVIRRMPPGVRKGGGAILVLLFAWVWTAGALWQGGGEKRVAPVVPGRLVRGAWQSPSALRAIIAREKIRTIVTLTAINRDDPKYVGQAEVVRQTGVEWLIIPMRGSQATLEQMAQAADLLADPHRHPVFFHCVAGHHRTNLAHAAYLIRHRQYSPERAWQAIAELPWSRPNASADLNDRALIFQFARSQSALASRAGTMGR
jgi:protein tyrosine phosphatase (PTP) superfamily phosphohydrolase (DUF442 family)